jgi:uncharacterized protein (TIGR02266 family)
MSATDKRERRNHFRGKPRPGRRVEVQYVIADAEAQKAYTRNIGVGGAFIVTSTPERPGTSMTLSLNVPTAPGGQPIQVKAEVRWNTSGDAEEPPGMGVKFYGLEVEQLLQLSEYFASLTGTDDASA